MKQNYLQKNLVVFLLAAICCVLWGSAFPCIKIGYALFEISGSDTAAIIFFGGTRFFIAGLLGIAIASLSAKKLIIPDGEGLKKAVLLSLFQTILQYLFFYIGLANTSGVKASIVESVHVFVAIAVSAWLFRQEKLTSRKVIGCVLGIIGVVLVNLDPTAMNFELSLKGEGFILISTLAYAFSTVIMKEASKTHSPVMLSGYQFAIGGLVMMAVGFAMGGRITHVTPAAIGMMLYLAFISAAAYSLWAILLKYNDVSKVSVYGFLTPVFGMVLSVLLLNEGKIASVKNLFALVIVCVGIAIVNAAGVQKKEQSLQ